MVIALGKLLDSIDGGRSIRSLSEREAVLLAAEAREKIINTISRTGGHLSSNLGSVELTIALHRVLDLPHDKLVWDVGHQSYTHKLLTHRLKSFDTLRQSGGISGFCDCGESEYDATISGHSSTSLSSAIGLAVARDLRGESHTVAAVIGDGALTGGLALEALNHIGQQQRRLLIVLNDNDMSITKNVGGISDYLTRVRTSPKYISSKKEIESLLGRGGEIGKALAKGVRRLKDNFKYLLSAGVFFEELGLTYIGPVDGHDIAALERTLRRALTLDEPVLVHAVTTKGKGYSFAQKDPGLYHGVSGFDILSGRINNGKRTFSDAFGDKLCSIAQSDSSVCAVTPSMTLGSALGNFASLFPSRFFDVGIAEAHAVTFSAALAAAGQKSVAAVYSSFLQRAYDSVIHDVAIPNLHVVLAVDRAGLVPGDGATHQGVFDIAFLSQIPNMAILSSSSFTTLEQMLDYAVNTHTGPIAVRYPRGSDESSAAEFEFQKPLIIRPGRDVTLVCEGTLTPCVLRAAALLEKKGVDAEVIDIQTIKPLNTKVIAESFAKTGRICTFEAGIKRGGLGEQIQCALGASVSIAAIDEMFLPHASAAQLLAFCRLDEESVVLRVLEELQWKSS